MGTRRDFRGADPAVKEELNETLDGLLADYPGIEPSKVVVGKMESDDDSPDEAAGTYGQTFERGADIHISRDMAKDMAAWRADMKQACRKGCLRHDLGALTDHPARYTLTHEFGHVVATDLIGPFNEESDAGDYGYRRIMLGAWRAVDPSIPADADPDAVPFLFSFGLFDVDAVTKDLSQYGAQGGPKELVAEAFAIHRLAGPGKSKIADYVHGELERLYVAKHGPRAAAA